MKFSFLNISSVHRAYGHCTALSQDRSTHVGCAIIQYSQFRKETNYNSTLLVCNYGSTNIIGERWPLKRAKSSEKSILMKFISTGQPVFEIGEPGSKCAAGKDGVFTSLCKPK